MSMSFKAILCQFQALFRMAGRFATPLLIGVSMVCLALYLTGLDYAPAPYFSDEALVSAEVIKLSRGWRDFGLLIRHSSRYADFSFFPYVFVSFLLTKVLGFSVYSFRLVSVILSVGTGLGLIFLGRLFDLKWNYLLLAPVFYWLMPPVIVQSRIAWDPAIFPLICLVAVCSLEWPARRINMVVSFPAWALAFLALNAGFWLGLVAWAYPPGRLCSVLLCGFYLARYWFACKKFYLRRLRSQFLIPFLLSFFGMGSVLLVSLKSTAGAMSRSTSELIIGQTSLLQKIFLRFFSNVTNLDYLLIDGDPNLRHSLPGMGALGVAGFVLLVCVVLLVLGSLFPEVCFAGRFINQYEASPHVLNISILCLLVVIFASPSFLGNTVVHSLRGCAAFPFWALLTSVLLAVTVQRFSVASQEFLIGLIVVAVAFSSLHLARYSLGGLSFMGKKQLQGPVPIHSTYPGLSRSAFMHVDYVAAQGLSGSEVCMRVRSSLNRPTDISYGEAVDDARSILIAAERSWSCADDGH